MSVPDCPAVTRVELPDGTTITVRCSLPDREPAHRIPPPGLLRAAVPDALGWSEHFVPTDRTGGARLIWPSDHTDRARWRT